MFEKGITSDLANAILLQTNVSEVGKFEIFSNKWSTADDFGEVRKSVNVSLFEHIIPFYAKLSLDASLGLAFFLREPLKNSYYHGGNGQPHELEFGVFISEKIIIAGHFDGGDYFSRQDVKEKYESRISVGEKHNAGVYGIGAGCGTPSLYYSSNLIFVDTVTRTLYAGISTNNGDFFSKL